MGRPLIDLSGRRVGRLLVLSRSADKNGQPHWLCRCDCGTETVVRGYHLKDGSTLSCGCLRQEQLSPRAITHGMSHSPEYYSWHGMLGRCTTPTDRQYARYGGRGITVCDRWLHSFENFLADMGPRPAPGYTVDRIDNNLGYSPDNCRWATKRQQSNNRRDCVYLTHDGQTHTVAEWARIVGICHATFQNRIKRGWTVERALTEPVHHR